MTAISVIIPTYNRAALVPLTIESVLAQTHPAAEIIVVDDGSKQDMREVLTPFASRVRVIRQPNGGLSAARNTGIEAASNEWVAFLDDDDEYTPDRLEQAALSIQRFPSADAHATNTAIVGSASPPIDLFKSRGLILTEPTPIERPLTWVMKGCFFAQSLVVRRSTIKEIGLFRKTFYEDLDLYVRLTCRKPWILSPRPGLRLIRRENTTAMSDDWRSRPLTRWEALVRIYREALALPGLTLPEIQQVRTGLASYLYELGTSLDSAGQSDKARACYAESARTYPAMHSRLKASIARFGGGGLIRALQKLKAPKKQLVR